MERRRYERFDTGQDVTLVLLGGQDLRMQARAANISGRGISLTVPTRVPAGAPVRIDWGDRLLLGEICYCVPEGAGFQIGIELEHALSSVSDLARLISAILGTERPPETLEVPDVSLARKLH